jgi:hypothetical protein
MLLQLESSTLGDRSMMSADKGPQLKVRARFDLSTAAENRPLSCPSLEWVFFPEGEILGCPLPDRDSQPGDPCLYHTHYK